MLAPALLAIATGIGPIIRSLNQFANAVVKLTGREPKDEVASAFTREEVAELVAESRREGLLDDEEHQLITSALDFDTTVVAAVMVPIAEVKSVEERVTPAEVELICARTGFSRFPILDPDGRFAGYLHIRDVVDIPAEQRDEPVPAGRIRALPAVAAGRPTCGPRWTGCGGSARTWPRSPVPRRPMRTSVGGDAERPEPDRSGSGGRRAWRGDARGRHRGADRRDPGRDPPLAGPSAPPATEPSAGRPPQTVAARCRRRHQA